MFRRRQTERSDVLARALGHRIDEQARQLRVLSDAVSSLTIETAAGARESRGLELLIATQLDVLRARLGAVTEMCELLSERIETDRLERRRLMDALVEVTREQRNGLTPGRRQVGVTVFAIEEGIIREPTTVAAPADPGELTD